MKSSELCSTFFVKKHFYQAPVFRFNAFNLIVIKKENFKDLTSINLHLLFFGGVFFLNVIIFSSKAHFVLAHFVFLQKSPLLWTRLKGYRSLSMQMKMLQVVKATVRMKY